MPAMRMVTIDSHTLKELYISHCSHFLTLTVHSHSVRNIVLEKNGYLQALSLSCPELLSLDMPKCPV